MLWFTINLCLSAAIFYVYLPKFKRFIENKANSGTIHEYLATAYCLGERHKEAEARRLRQLAAIPTGLALVLALAFELHLGSAIAAKILNLEIVPVFCGLAIIVAFYSFVGSYRSVVWTDAIQSVFLFFGAISLIVLISRLSASSHHLLARYPVTLKGFWNIGWHNIVGIVVVGSGWFLVAMDNWQRTCATRSVKTSAWSFGAYTVFIIGFGVLFGLWGMYDGAVVMPSLSQAQLALHSKGSDPIADFMLVALQTDALNSFLLGVIAVALVMAAMSTADTFLVTAAHMITADAVVAKAKWNSWDDIPPEKSTTFSGLGRSFVLIFAAAMIGAWNVLHQSGGLKDIDAVSFFFVAYSSAYALMMPVVFSVLPEQWRPSPLWAGVAICLGLVMALVVGLGAWICMQRQVASALGMPTANWFALTPVAAAAAGLLVLGLGAVRRRLLQ